MARMKYPNLAGKILQVYQRNRPLDDGVVLQHGAFEIQGDRVFLTGEFAEGVSADDWAAGVRTAIAWDAVEQYLVFDSYDDYMSRASQVFPKDNYH
jgi:hypothetical protein